MSELRLVKKSLSATRLNILFIHGLQGDAEGTWQSRSAPPEFWPNWLFEDLGDGVSVWTVGYPVDASFWRSNGYAMAIQDRAANLLSIILAHQELRTGEVAFVGHSMGGLIIKQIIRTTEGYSRSRQDALNLLSRIRRVAFVATPHQGSDKASFVDSWRIVFRPTIAITGLIKSNPHLRELNLWYRGWAAHQKMQHLILVETRPLGKFGIIVDRESSDPGINVDPIPLDEDHSSICKPMNKNSPIYVLIKEFLASTVAPPPPNSSEIFSKVNINSKMLDQLQSDSAEVKKGVAELIEISHKATTQSDPKLIAILDEELECRITKIRKSRFYPTFPRREHAKKLSEDIISGHLATASNSTKAIALAWCSRIIGNDDMPLTKELCQRSIAMGEFIEAKIAFSLILRMEGQYQKALSVLLAEDSNAARGAAFMMTVLENKVGAIDWLKRSQLTASMLDSDGKLYLILTLLEQDQWEQAYETVEGLSANDYSSSPALYYISGLAVLGAAIPKECRSAIMQGIPFGLYNFPLGDAVVDVMNRSRARDLFHSAALAANHLDSPIQEGIYLDLHLWLMLRDSKTFDEGMRLLKSSLSDPKSALRRVNFIADFGLQLDIPAIEREIERQQAISGGEEVATDIAVARLVISMNQENPVLALRYLRQYKKQLLSRVAKEMVDSIELQMLIRTGDLAEAESLISQLKSDGATAQQMDKYQNLLLEVSDQAKGIEGRIAAYAQSSKLSDLAVLAQALLENKDWIRLAKYSKLLFNETHAIRDAEMVVSALENSELLNEVHQFLQQNQHLRDSSNLLLSAWSWSTFRQGMIAESKKALLSLLKGRDAQRDRNLEVSIAIACGEWDTLVEFCEKQWRNREERHANELIFSAHIAFSVSSPRAKDLLIAAVGGAPNDPQILANGYFLATEAGWDNDDMVSSWLQQASEKSGEEGPIRIMPIQDLIDRQPKWNEHASKTLRSLNLGEMPIFMAAKAINRTLLDFVLTPALLNPQQTDVRKKVAISAFSGARPSVSIAGGKIALDATSILTLGLLGLLEKLYEVFDQIFIPHSTLNWLFEERRKVSFHQPSQIVQAEYIRGLVSTGVLEVMPKSQIGDDDLAIDIGDELASCIAESISNEEETGAKSFVVTPFPVHRASSLMQEEVDLSHLHSKLCGTWAILRKLDTLGLLPESEKRSVFAYINLREHDWPNQTDLPDNANLYLSDLTLTYCYSAGILKYFKSANFKAAISQQTIQRVNALLERGNSSRDELSFIDGIREFLERGLKDSKLALLPQVNTSAAKENEILRHPSLSIIHNVFDVDSLVIDDRYLNRNWNFQDDSGRTGAIMTTIDVLHLMVNHSKISEVDFWNSLTSLRRSGYYFVPIVEAEITAYLERASIDDGRIIETAELRAIREYLLKLRMGNILSVASEVPWFQIVMDLFTKLIKKQWIGNTEREKAEAFSDWLWQQIDVFRWASVFGDEVTVKDTENQYKVQHLYLLFDLMEIVERRTEYWDWLDRKVLKNMRESFPAIYNDLLQHLKDVIVHVVSNEPETELSSEN